MIIKKLAFHKLNEEIIQKDRMDKLYPSQNKSVIIEIMKFIHHKFEKQQWFLHEIIPIKDIRMQMLTDWFSKNDNYALPKQYIMKVIEQQQSKWNKTGIYVNGIINLKANGNVTFRYPYCDDFELIWDFEFDSNFNVSNYSKYDVLDASYNLRMPMSDLSEYYPFISQLFVSCDQIIAEINWIWNFEQYLIPSKTLQNMDDKLKSFNSETLQNSVDSPMQSVNNSFCQYSQGIFVFSFSFAKSLKYLLNIQKMLMVKLTMYHGHQWYNQSQMMLLHFIIIHKH